MKNYQLKNSFIAASIAVFAGVVTLGANVAFGAPTQDPTTAGLVSPTFGDVTVNGKAFLNEVDTSSIINTIGDLIISTAVGKSVRIQNPAYFGTTGDGLQIDGDKAAISSPSVTVNIKGDLSVKPGIGGTGAGYFDGNLGTNGLLQVGTGIGSLYNIGVAVKDDLNIMGKNPYDSNTVRITGDSNSISSDSGTLAITSKLDAQQEIKNTGTANSGAVYVNDNLAVTGDASVRSLKVTLNNVDVPTGAVNALQLVATNGVIVGFFKTTGAITAAALNITNDLGISSSSPSGKVRIESPIDAWYGIVNTVTDNVGNPMPVEVDDKLSVVQPGGGAGTSTALNLTAGNTNNYFGNNQITFGYNGTNNYMDAIKSRHNSNAKAGNALDFYVWNQGVDAAGAVGTKQVMTLDGTGNVGVGTTNPAYTLDVNGDLSTSGDLVVAGMNSKIRSSGSQSIEVGSNVNFDGTVNIRNPGYLMNSVDGIVKVGSPSSMEDLSVNGKVTASGGFGTITPYSGASIVVNSNGESSTAKCASANEKLLSCGSSLTAWGYINEIDPNYATKTCTVYARDLNNGGGSLVAKAICLDPTK